MTRTGLLVATLAFLVGLACVDFAFGRYARSHFLPETQFQTALRRGTDCIVTLGDSRMLVGVDPELFPAELSRRDVDACHAHLAIGGGQGAAHYFALRRYIEVEGRRPRLVVWGLNADAALPIEAPPENFAGNNATVLAWSRASNVTLLYPGFPLSSLDQGFRFLAARSTDLSAYASLLWNRVQRVQDRFTEPPEPAERNRFGLLSDMDALGRSMATNLLETKLAATALHPAVPALAALCEQYGIPVLFVEVPMPEAHRRVVDVHPNTARVRDALAKLAKAHHGSFASFDDASWLEPRLFGDPVHVGPAGARKFSVELAELVARQLSRTATPAPAPPAQPSR